MFEDSLIESGGKIKTKATATVVISAIFHVALITVLLLVPLLSIDAALPTSQLMMFLVAPPPPPPAEAAPAPVVQKQVQVDPGTMVQPTEIPKDIQIVRDEGPPPSAGVVG